MVEKNYILLFGSDFITSSILTLSINKKEPHSKIYFTQNPTAALNLVEIIANSPNEYNYHQKEIKVIIELNKSHNAENFFLDNQLHHQFPVPVSY